MQLLFFNASVFKASSQNYVKYTISCVMSVGPSVCPRDGFSWNLILVCFPTSCWENLSLIKIMTSTLHNVVFTCAVISRSVLLRLRLVSEMWRKSKHLFYVQWLFSENRTVHRDNVAIFGTCSHVTDYNTGLSKMIVGVLATYHTQYIWDRSM
jgi:hypothetical protein